MLHSNKTRWSWEWLWEACKSNQEFLAMLVKSTVIDFQWFSSKKNLWNEILQWLCFIDFCLWWEDGFQIHLLTYLLAN